MGEKPFLESDKTRVLYSRIRYLSINDREAFKAFFEGFKQTNDGPFWWKIVIFSSGSFMKSTLERGIKDHFSGEERVFLEQSMGAIAGLNFKRYVKSRRTLYKLDKPFNKVIKKFRKKGDLFERTMF